VFRFSQWIKNYIMSVGIKQTGVRGIVSVILWLRLNFKSIFYIFVCARPTLVACIFPYRVSTNSRSPGY